MSKKLTIEEYKEKVDEYRELLFKHNVNYSIIIYKYWYGVTGKGEKDLKVKLRNFMKGHGYVNAYDEKYSFMPKVEELVEKYITKKQ